jgi:micrococcal nuclease
MYRASCGLLLVFPFLVASAVLAHSGGVDSSGCHTDGQNGGYHCHGSPAYSPSSGSGSPYAPSSTRVIYTNSPHPYTRYWPPVRRPAPPPVKQAASLLSVGDGDTIRVTTSDGKKLTIRLACIDAPEATQGVLAAYASSALSGFLEGASLQILPRETDKYGRTVAEVFANGRNVNLAMVQSGQAFAYRKYLSGCDQSAYLSAEEAAERQRAGVWRYPGAVQRPWEFRESRRN